MSSPVSLGGEFMSGHKNGYIYCHALSENENAILTLAVLKKGAHTALECGVIDLITKEKLECIEYVFGKKGVKNDLFESGKIEVETKNGSFALFSKGDGRHIKINFKKCLAHTALSLEIVLKPIFSGENDDSDDKTGFFTADGVVRVKEREYVFSQKKSVGVFRSTRGFSKKSRYGAGFAFVGEKLLALVSDFESPDKNCVYYDGALYKTGDFLIEKGESFEKAWVLSSQKYDMKMTFSPKFNDRIDVSRPWLKLHGDRVFGAASGSMSSNGGGRVEFFNMHCLYENLD